jgi:hypothetical protein
MHLPIHFVAEIQPAPHSVSRSPLRALFFIALALAFFALLKQLKRKPIRLMALTRSFPKQGQPQ